MTYKSTSDQIKARIRRLRGAGLRYLPHPVPGAAPMRELFVSDEVWDAVNPPWPNGRDGKQHIVFRATLDRFTSGERLNVAEDPFEKPSYTVIARTAPTKMDIWDFRCMTEDDGIRCFGTFGGKDLFIALTWDFRDGLNFEAEVNRCRRDWDRLFDGIPPFRARSLDDYGSNFVAAPAR